ncbi:hypothetical protein [Streptomyces sp. NBC_01718]|uniref:hypothetical protein n=1 Tax=Streptomyces sp. NBC_01718 TaxID=2975919 RepID=UPI00352E22A6
MELHIDIRWLLERQAEVLPKAPVIHDFSCLVAAVGRHRVNTPKVGAVVDNAWRAAVRPDVLRPLVGCRGIGQQRHRLSRTAAAEQPLLLAQEFADGSSSPARPSAAR